MHEAQINNDVIAYEAWPENELTNSTITYCGGEYSKPDRKDIRIRPVSKAYCKNSKEQTKECRNWCQNRIWHDGNKKIRCLHKSGGKDPCRISSNQYLIGFGVIRISASQIPEFHETCLLSIVAAIMSSVYSIIGCSLAINLGNTKESYVNSKFSEATVQEITKMAATKLFRTLPCSNHDGKLAEAYDPEEEEPTLEPAWSHLVYW
ncbi:hypothetical protein KIW84_036167 [Lathyrus oleraceus]|uniref:Uncharacterized protein n=1 Tax=Pisum sativum TaxID=3888 RepID=A0A9D5B734_PEA|nr:hypothetical protein KIW84_036167 [Pisum sativum]